MHTWVDGGDQQTLQCEQVYLDSDCNNHPDPQINGCVIRITDCCCRMCSDPVMPVRFCHCVDCEVIPASTDTATGEAMLKGKFKIRVSDGGQSRDMLFERDSATGKWMMEGTAYQFNGTNGFTKEGRALEGACIPEGGLDDPSGEDSKFQRDGKDEEE
jgi:hypothetical protein